MTFSGLAESSTHQPIEYTLPSSIDVAPWKGNSQPISVAIGGAPEPTRDLRHVLGLGPTSGMPSAGHRSSSAATFISSIRGIGLWSTTYAPPTFCGRIRQFFFSPVLRGP